MKIKLLMSSMLVASATIFFSCKGEKKNETEAATAETVKEAPVSAITYTVDTNASIIEWIGSKPLENHTGTIKLSKGALTAKEGALESGTFTINMSSIAVTDLEGDGKASLEGHLKGASKENEDHFFNVSKFPTASFEITGITAKEGKKYLEGNLTIKGITKNISFPAATSIEGDTMTLSTETFTIDRTQWGVNYASKSIFGDIGEKFIKDDIQLKVSLKAKKA
ncbi:YceI family protein [Aquimarina sp. 2201CG5-10]|uniref:YceI family protein n=1 Tax=Aquimarina callyspongiae TaxID=3098150 RepID=UPI002AB4127C|nr:YceI family protein [Aquimarina sp. 2201CG5-10]MDY8134129.1 YceI family protein [Aquimarina sp. 2201CG5-10]